MEQLDLDLGARLYAFPVARDVRRVRAIASRLNELQGDDATTYWRDVVTALRSELGAWALPSTEINRQIVDLFDSVQDALALTVIMRSGGGA